MKLPPVVERLEQQTPENPAPICVLVVGMAGSGKTTLMAQLQQSTMAGEGEQEAEGEGEREENPSTKDYAKPSAEMPAYCINLDPATLDVPYSPSIDIRDTVDYKVCRSHCINKFMRDKAETRPFFYHRRILLTIHPRIPFVISSKSCLNTI